MAAARAPAARGRGGPIAGTGGGRGSFAAGRGGGRGAAAGAAGASGAAGGGARRPYGEALNVYGRGDDDKPDYAGDVERLKRFLEGYRRLEDAGPFYPPMLQEVADRQRAAVPIELDHVMMYFDGIDDGLVERIEGNALRYVELFSHAIDQAMPMSTPGLVLPANDVIDVLVRHRQQTLLDEADAPLAAAAPLDTPAGPTAPAAAAAGGVAAPAAANRAVAAGTTTMPAQLTRRYEVQLIPRAKSLAAPIQLRQIRAKHIGKVVVMKGIVTRTSEVKPQVTIATYTCDECGCENYQEVKAAQFMPLQRCSSATCMKNNSAGKLFLQTRGSKFIKFQELRVQELPEQVPIGHIPRSITVHALGEATRRCSPGDVATISGIFLPTPYSGWQALRAGLIADTYLQAMHIEQHKVSYADYELTDEVVQRATLLAEERNVYDRLAKSIAPEIFGHDDVKKALLLVMVGGATRVLNDGMKIRGDINILLLGDPGVAKSQLLKHIATISPRGVYTSGKGASAVGLTAAVVRDPTTNELVLEGGSLVLADMGICCIDEFDKMDDSDRTAIHEVMEQQTISIAKAGINTTLNARTAIVAAANPAYGRYNIRRSPADNINLPAALLSRFDLLFVLLDKPDSELDMRLAQHITHVHKHGRHPESEYELLDTEFIRTYIAQARRIEPYVPPELTEFIVASYVGMRQAEDSSPQTYTYTTARSLLAILRLSQALARLSLREVVAQQDVEEAIRLMDQSKASLREERQQSTASTDPVSAIYRLIRDMCIRLESTTLAYNEVLRRVVAHGFTNEQLNECLETYERLDILQLAANRSSIKMIN